MESVKFMMVVMMCVLGLTAGSGMGQTPGCSNQVLSLDGNSGIRVPDHPDLDITTSITIEFWHKAESVQSPGWIIAKWGVSDFSYGVAVYPSLEYDFSLSDDAHNTTSDAPFHRFFGGTVILNQWQHVAVTFDGNSRKMYINGNFIAEQISPSGIHSSIIDLAIGAGIRNNGVALSDFYVGLIDEMRLWSVARTQEEIQSTMSLRIDAAAVPSHPGLVAAWNFEGNALDSTGVHNGVEMGNVQYVFENLCDCNGNGVIDFVDITNGTSQDVNGSGTPDECECLADISPIFTDGTHGNGIVNIDDLVFVLNSFGQSTSPGQPTNIGDTNFNGVVNIDDLVAVLNAFGGCP